MMSKKSHSRKSNTDLMRYAGWGTQLFVLLALAVYGGLKLDEWLRISVPLLVWVLPFIVLVVMIWQLIKDTSKKKNSNDQGKVEKF
jgi:branched-subunit amino acid permease